MASLATAGESSSATQAPTATQLLFARAVILTMELWPAMRLAVSEQWGGVDSRDKRDYLISHICDTYSTETPVTASSSTVKAPAAPDVDDLADTLKMYFDDEYESRIEDGSPEWVAARIVNLHKIIYTAYPPTQDSLAAGQAEVDKVYEATTKLRGQKMEVQRGQESGSGEDTDGSDEESEEEGHSHAHAPADVAMDVDDAPSTSAPQRQRAEPVVDEDGFTTVVKGKRR